MAIEKTKSAKARIKCETILAQAGDTLVFSYRENVSAIDLNNLKEIYKRKTNWRIDRGKHCHDVASFYGFNVDNDRVEVEAINIQSGKTLWKKVIGEEIDFIPSLRMASNGKELLVCFEKMAFLLDCATGDVLKSKTSFPKLWGLVLSGDSFYAQSRQQLFRLGSDLEQHPAVEGWVSELGASETDVYCRGEFEGERDSFVWIDGKTGVRKKRFEFDRYLSTPNDIFPLPGHPHLAAITLTYGPIAAMLNFDTEKVEWITALLPEHDYEDTYHGMDIVFSDLGMVVSMWSLGRDQGAYVLVDPQTGEEIHRFYRLGTSHEQSQFYLPWKGKLVEIGEKKLNIYEKADAAQDTGSAPDFLTVYED